MIELPIYNKQGKQVDTLAIDEAQLGDQVRRGSLKQAYVMFHANRRQASSRTKSRGMVDGSTRKMYRQKGTGNARVGARRTLIRKGGGVAFAKTRTSFRMSMPKKMRRLANRNALLAKLVDSEVKCVDDLGFKSPKTSEFRALLEALGINRTCLVALDRENRNAALSARNIDEVDTISVEQLNAFELLNHRFLVVEKASLAAFLDGSVWKRDDEDESKKSPAKGSTGAKRKKKEAA